MSEKQNKPEIREWLELLKQEPPIIQRAFGVTIEQLEKELGEERK